MKQNTYDLAGEAVYELSMLKINKLYLFNVQKKPIIRNKSSDGDADAAE